jgi:hypothetical protein
MLTCGGTWYQHTRCFCITRVIQRTNKICFSYISCFIIGLACPVLCLAFARSATNSIRGMYPLLCVVPWDVAIQNIKTTAHFLYQL